MASIRTSLGVLAAAMGTFGIAAQYQSQTAITLVLGLGLFIPLAFCWLIYCTLQQRWRPVRIVALLTVVAAGVMVSGYFSLAKARRRSQDSAIATYQIQAAVDLFFFQNPQRVFANYEDVIGPQRYLKAARAFGGEDYHELFPVRAEYEAMGVTMGDGRVNLVLRGAFFVQRLPNGELRGNPEGVRVYQALLSSRKNRKGVHVTSPFQGGRFETTWRDGGPDGPFRAYYTDGKLWAEASYVSGVPSGRHVVYDRAGKIIYEKVFVPWRRGH